MAAVQPPTGTAVATRRLRRFPLPYVANRWQFLSRLTFILQPGVGTTTGQGVDPQVMLRLSRDGGQTWGPELWTSAGAIGEYERRAYFTRLGKARNFVVEMAVSDPVLWGLMDCVIDLEAGMA